ncbi:MAG: 2-isopropylmalate synthase [Treponema sp.]|nr:2-isopropylmalate synthase [Treponema sp.]
MNKYSESEKIGIKDRTWPDKSITRAPRWCSVDLRDGNQALAIPMNIREKHEFFDLLVKIGFTEIEVGFPSASQIEFDFIRSLIDGKKADNVYLQVLTQSREHLIRRTFESLKGAKKAVLHLYNSTSPLQREITFHMSKEEITAIAVNGTRLVKSLFSEYPDTEFIFEYSPESFSGTEIDYAVEICQAVRKAMMEGGLPPNVSKKIIFNLPTTVEAATPNVYADQIEYFCRHIGDRDSVVVSLHTHNDRGTGTAATELGLMAGADRVEGTIFGNGERTGNLDIINVALNMFSQGLDPKLNLKDLPRLREVYERCTGMKIPPRQPYAGELVFTAFSGSHQDAIKKGFDYMNAGEHKNGPWKVPYLLIDPRDIGRDYEAIIRINSQSGKGGVAYILQTKFGYDLPKMMHPAVGKIVNDISDSLGRELDSGEVLDIFTKNFLNIEEPLKLVSWAASTVPGAPEKIHCNATIIYNGMEKVLSGEGNGNISAFVDALHEEGINSFDIADFSQHSVGAGAKSEAVAYVGIKDTRGATYWGSGRHTDIAQAGIIALVSAYNRMHKQTAK